MTTFYKRSNEWHTISIFGYFVHEKGKSIVNEKSDDNNNYFTKKKKKKLHAKSDKMWCAAMKWCAGAVTISIGHAQVYALASRLFSHSCTPFSIFNIFNRKTCLHNQMSISQVTVYRHSTKSGYHAHINIYTQKRQSPLNQ